MLKHFYLKDLFFMTLKHLLPKTAETLLPKNLPFLFTKTLLPKNTETLLPNKVKHFYLKTLFHQGPCFISLFYPLKFRVEAQPITQSPRFALYWS
jgi:hypothetical protein